MTKPTLNLSREMWDALCAASRIDLANKYEILVRKHYYPEVPQ